MYEFRQEKNYKEFDDFVKENGGTYMQCSLWPNAKPEWESHFYVGFNGSERVFQCLILGRKLPFAGLMWYIPDGFICDYTNKKLIAEFVSFIKTEMKKNNVTALLTDPHIPLRINHEYQSDGLSAHKMMIDSGFKLNHNIENYIYKSPVQYYLPLKNSETNEPYTAEQLIHNCEKGIRYSVRIGTQRGLVSKVCSYDEINKNPELMNDFMQVMGDTSGRNDFLERSSEYTLNLLKVFKDYADISLVYYDKDEDKKLQDERDRQVESNLKKMETCNEKQKKKLSNDNEAIQQQTDNYTKRKKIADEFSNKSRFVVAGGFTIRYNGIAGCVFGGSRNILRNETRPSHYVNYLRLKKSVDTGMDIHDFGYVFVSEKQTPSDPNEHLSEFEVREDFKGIRDFKESFNTDLIEFIGEYALVNNSAKFKLYSDIVPKARKTKINITKKIVKR